MHLNTKPNSAVPASLQARVQRLLRPDVQGLHAYAVQPSTGMVKLDTMENPFGLPARLQAGGHCGVGLGIHVHRAGWRWAAVQVLSRISAACAWACRPSP
ncbi:MAG: hypothetical protein ACKOGB_01880 [Betaproteobacteria bacterium]